MKEIPSLLLTAIGFNSWSRTKEILFSRFFRGWQEAAFLKLCDFLAERNKHILRPGMLQKIQDSISSGEKVVVITSSGEQWVKAFLKELPEIEIIGTQIEISQGLLTGRFSTPNCNGIEKVRRLMALYPERKTYSLIVYGNSKSDQQLLDFADEGHLL